MTQNWSFWERDLYFNGIDYLIIGAGIVGMTTSIYLKQKYPDAKVVIVEKKFPGLGASTKNAGFACFGSVTEILDDIEQNGEDKAIELLRTRWKGLNLLKSLVPEYRMQYETNGSYELFLEDSSLMESAIANISRVNELACHALEVDSVFEQLRNKKFSRMANTTIYCQQEGQLNPAMMMHSLQYRALSQGVKILYGIEISEIKNQKAISTDGDVLNAKDIILCNNGFAKKIMAFRNVEMVRNQVLITKPIENFHFKGTYHIDRGYIYFREYQGRLLIGGARNLRKKEETTGDFGQNADILAYLKSLVRQKILPGKDIQFEHNWSGILGIGPVKSPIIKKIEPHLYAGIRLGGMGVAIGSYVGRELADMVD